MLHETRRFWLYAPLVLPVTGAIDLCMCNVLELYQPIEPEIIHASIRCQELFPFFVTLISILDVETIKKLAIYAQSFDAPCASTGHCLII